MTTSTCHAAVFLSSGGPVQVPLRACCAAAVIRSATAPGPAAGLSSAPFVCVAAGLTVRTDAWLAEGPAAAGLTIPADAWLAESSVRGELTIPADLRLAEDAAIVGAEHIP